MLKSKFQILDWSLLPQTNIVLGGAGALEILKAGLEEAGFAVRANPDYLEREVGALGIDEARELARWADLKPIAGQRKIAVWLAGSLNSEAQNALLKTLEEPFPHTYFFFILPNKGGLLPTLLSRARVHQDLARSEVALKASSNFWNLSVAEKLKLIKKLSAEEDKEPLRRLIKNLPEKSATEFDAKRVLLAKRFASLRGSSPKLLLEWLTTSV